MQKLRHILITLDKQIPDYLGLGQAGRFISNNAHLLTGLLLLGAIAYGYDLTSFSLKIDSENHAYFYGPQRAWVTQGRWGMYLLSGLLLPDAVMPFFPTLVAIIGLAFSAVFFVHALSRTRCNADYLVGALAIASPVIYFGMYFTTLGYGLGAAFAISALGIYLLDQDGWRERTFAILCFTFGIGIYQAVLPLLACLFCLQHISRILSAAEITITALAKSLARFILCVVIASILSGLLGKAFITALNMKYDNNAYLSQFIQFSLTPSYIRNAFTQTLSIAWDYYTGSREYYLYNLVALRALFLITATITIWRILCAPRPVAIRILGLLLLVAAAFAPMAMHLLNAGSMPPRTVLGITFVMAALVYFSVTTTSNIVRIAIYALSVLAFCNFSMINNRYALSNQMTWLADRELSVQLLERIHSVEDKLPLRASPRQQLPLEVVGWHEYDESPIFVHREVIGSSFYTWGAGDAQRIVRLFATMGVPDYRAATREEKLSVLDPAYHMPSWPDKGSVDVINGIIVVKLSNYNPHQIEGICEPLSSNNIPCQQYLSR